jgi:formylglycine-generating enzyme required for sulfatase activity
MDVPVGEVEVRAVAMGRRSVYRRLDLPPGGEKLHLFLSGVNVPAGSHLRDELSGGGNGPEMIVVSPGEFVMGSDSGPPSERPARRVVITEPFAVSVTEVRVDEYRRFARAIGRRVHDRLAQAPDEVPVTRVSFADALVYADWLSAQTGHHYRLLSEAEWEYMARGGTRTAYFFGDDPDELCGYGNVADIALRTRYTGFDTADCDDGYVELAPVASFRPNPFGIHDVHGNVAEWVLECGMPAYQGAPDDATPIDPGARCPTHGVRGGSWDGTVSDARSSKRNLASSAGGDRGIRLLREL